MAGGAVLEDSGTFRRWYLIAKCESLEAGLETFIAQS